MTRQINATDLQRVAGIPTPTPTVEELYQTVMALKEVVEVLARQSRTVEQSSVRLTELERLGFITVYSNGKITSDILSRIEALE